MKKFFWLMLSSIYILLFFVLLSIFSENDNYNVYNGFGFNDEYDNLSIYFEDPLQGDEKIEVIKRVDEIVSTHEIAVIVNHYIEEDDQVVGIKNYISGKNPFVLDMLPNNISLKKDFYKGRQYISNDSEEDRNKIDLFTFYQGFTYEIIPFHYLEENLEIVRYNLNVHFNAIDRVLVKTIIENEFSDFNISVDTLAHTSYDRDEELEKSILYISV